MTRKSIRESVKKQICYRQSYKCAKCFDLLPPSLQIDHIIPYCLSQNHEEDNLQALCPNCHSLKSQKETIRISQYKKILKECPEDIKLCWFCLETFSGKHSCDKTLKDIPALRKIQDEVKCSFEEMCAKYKYIKREEKEDVSSSLLTININLYNYTINVNKVIVKFTDNDLTTQHIVDAVFLATRTKKDSKRYTNVELTIDSDDEEGKEACLKFIDESDFMTHLPERIFKNFNETLLIIVN